MSEGSLTLLGDPTEDVDPDPSEVRLRELYAHRPGVVRLHLIASADGRTAGPDGSSRTLTGDADQRVHAVLRSVCDVVLVGAQTARRERYTDLTLPQALTDARVGTGLRPEIEVAVVTHGGILPSGLTPSRTWVITHAGAPAVSRLGPEWAPRIIVAGDEDVSLRTATRQLADHGLTRVLCEGGPTVASRLLQRGLVDDYCLTDSPATGGPQAPAVPDAPRGLVEGHTLAADGFTMRRWMRR